MNRRRVLCCLLTTMWGISACRADEPEPTAPEQVVALSPDARNPAPTDVASDEPRLAEDVAPKVEEPAFPPDERPLRVLILGDSLAATGFGALLERALDKNPEIEAHRRAKSATGLARPDFFDWMSEARKAVEKHEPHLVIVVMGGNDGQDLQPLKKGDGPRVEWKHEDWEGAYRKRMDDFLALVTGPERHVLWLGLPTMGIESFENKLTLIRRIQQEAITALGSRGAYLDTAPFVSDENGKMLLQASIGGRMQTIRDKDRIHFTMAGSQYFADLVYPEVLGVLGLPKEAKPSEKAKAEQPEIAQAGETPTPGDKATPAAAPSGN